MSCDGVEGLDLDSGPPRLYRASCTSAVYRLVHLRLGRLCFRVLAAQLWPPVSLSSVVYYVPEGAVEAILYFVSRFQPLPWLRLQPFFYYRVIKRFSNKEDCQMYLWRASRSLRTVSRSGTRGGVGGLGGRGI